MELSSDDIRRLEEAGYRRDQFSFLHDREVRLVNVAGWCFFYSLADRNCRVYKDRPLGCRLYPVVYLADEGAVVDGLCPMGHSVSEQELKRKEKILVKLLKEIDDERKCE
jgi:Fe-S-cluster containining protein